MNKRLVVYFTICSMSDNVAKRGMYGPPKEYKREPMRTDFDPDTTTSSEAIKQITDKYGEKPVQRSAMACSTNVGHQFAEIRYWRTIDVRDRPKEDVDELYQPELFPDFQQK